MDNLRVTIEGNKVDGYDVHLFEGDKWRRRVRPGRGRASYFTRWGARRAARRALRMERARRSKIYRAEIS